jgi:hypothetical protein
MYYFSVLAIFKNETMNLKEWIDHYFWQGAEHLYMIDNDSSDNPIQILNPYITEGKISYYFLPKKWKQLEYYKMIFNLIKKNKESYWLCITDLDEFWYTPNNKLVNVLKEYENYSAIHSNWLMFGSDGHIVHPKSIRKSIIKREPKPHKLTKFIIKVQDINEEDFNIHVCNVKKNIIENNKIKLNHYPIQSLEFFQKVKMTRGACDGEAFENIRDMNYFNAYDQNKTVIDTTLADLISF